MTAATEGKRRLLAIMFTDIKGYSAMMGVDEARTVRLVLEHRTLVREVLHLHGGTEHETIGDAFVVLFDSVVDAVRCGVEIQRRLRGRNTGLPAEDQVWLRIGIHLGDIILQQDGIYGDGVNLAARIEQLADPGGVCISEQVWLQVDGKVDFVAEPMGRVDLKNIRNPPKLYRIRLDDAAGAPKRAAARKGALVAAALLLLAVLAGGAWLAQRPEPVPPAGPTPVAPAPQPPPPTVADAPALPDKAVIGRKVREAMAATGAARVTLLEEAAQLDPDNVALMGMLQTARAETAAAAGAQVPPAAAPQPAAATAVPAKARSPQARSPRAADDQRIRPSIVTD